MAGSREVLEKLNDKYDLYIVSAATEFPQSLPEKQWWLGQHFPFIQWQKIVFCGSKEIIKADIMIDDHFKNLDFFSGPTTYLFTQPHNQKTDPGKHRRVHGWDELASLLL
jgi:5'-nucleotidase